MRCASILAGTGDDLGTWCVPIGAGEVAVVDHTERLREYLGIESLGGELPARRWAQSTRSLPVAAR